MAVWRGRESETNLFVERVCVGRKVIFRAAIPFRFPMKIPVFDVKPHGQSHVSAWRKLFAVRPAGGRPAEVKNRRVFPLEHFGAQFDFDGAAITRVGDKLPDRLWTGVERHKILRVERREETVGIGPDTHPFTKTWRSTGTPDANSHRAHNRIWN